MDLDELLSLAVKRPASDLHPQANPHPAMRLLGEDRYNDLMGGQEKDLGYALEGFGRFRGNLFLSQGEVRAVLRHIPGRIPGLEELHLPKSLERLAMERRGVGLVTGITGPRPATTPAA